MVTLVGWHTLRIGVLGQALCSGAALVGWLELKGVQDRVSQGAPFRGHPGGQLELRQVWAGCLGYFVPGGPW